MYVSFKCSLQKCKLTLDSFFSPVNCFLLLHIIHSASEMPIWQQLEYFYTDRSLNIIYMFIKIIILLHTVCSIPSVSYSLKLATWFKITNTPSTIKDFRESQCN